jgi:hypothetical protein
MPEQRRQKEEPYKEGEWEVIWRERFKWNRGNKQKSRNLIVVEFSSKFSVVQQSCQNTVLSRGCWRGSSKIHSDLIPCIQLVDNIIDRTNITFILAANLTPFLIYLLIHSFCSLCYDSSTSSSEASSLQIAISCFFLSISSTTSFPAGHPVAAYVFFFVVPSQRNFPLSFPVLRLLQSQFSIGRDLVFPL